MSRKAPGIVGASVNKHLAVHDGDQLATHLNNPGVPHAGRHVDRR